MRNRKIMNCITLVSYAIIAFLWTQMLFGFHHKNRWVCFFNCCWFVILFKRIMLSFFQKLSCSVFNLVAGFLHLHRRSNEGVKEKFRKRINQMQKHWIQMPLTIIPKSFLLELISLIISQLPSVVYLKHINIQIKATSVTEDRGLEL